MPSPQTLSDPDRRTVARWAAACAEHVLPLFAADRTTEAVVHEALDRTREYSAGGGTAADQISRRLVVVKIANLATTAAGAAAARAVAQAAAVAHMGAHALGAAAYAARAVSLSEPHQPDAAGVEVRWQLAQLDDRERSVLRQLPALGTDSSGPLGPGLLSRGALGATIRDIQAQIA